MADHDWVIEFVLPYIRSKIVAKGFEVIAGVNRRSAAEAGQSESVRFETLGGEVFNRSIPDFGRAGETRNEYDGPAVALDVDCEGWSVACRRALETSKGNKKSERGFCMPPCFRGSRAQVRLF